jgi:type IV pilus assembly protein PilQ
MSSAPIISNPLSGAQQFLRQDLTFIPDVGFIESAGEELSFFDGTLTNDPNFQGFVTTDPETGESTIYRRTGLLGNIFSADITDDPLRVGISNIDEGGTFERELPSLIKYPTKFLLELESQIVNGNAKILTDPTLVVQEGQEATVKLVEQVLTSVTTSIDLESGTRTVTPEIGEAGLNLAIKVERIDDNGFISLSVTPRVSALSETITFDAGGGAQNTLSLLNVRELSSGLIRLRDAQTLIISGIIQESDRTTVSKVPLLGDIPLLGALFRSTSRSTDRKEVVVVLTPQIIDDSERSGWGYNYQPGPNAREMLRNSGVNVPGSPY